MEMAYGINVKSNEDRFLRAAVEAAEVAKRAVVPGTFLVDAIPICASHDASKDRSVTSRTIGNSETHP